MLGIAGGRSCLLLSALGCCGLRWVALGFSVVFWVAFGCSGLLRAALSCSGPQTGFSCLARVPPGCLGVLLVVSLWSSSDPVFQFYICLLAQCVVSPRRPRAISVKIFSYIGAYDFSKRKKWCFVQARASLSAVPVVCLLHSSWVPRLPWRLPAALGRSVLPWGVLYREI